MFKSSCHLAEFCILLGNRCNFTCDHCAVSAHPNGKDLTKKETAILSDVVSTYRPETILFSGGEPSLYISTINQILSACRNIYIPKIVVTTNGYFATDVPRALKILSSIKHLTKVQLSYDKFHRKFLSQDNVQNLYLACKKMGLKFSIIYSIQSPLDLAEIGLSGKAWKSKISPLKVLPLGKAGKNGLEFNYPEFDTEVLKKRCPDRNKVVYVYRKGFSLCCASLAFGKHPQNCFYKTLDGFISSNFRKMMQKNTFSMLLQKFNLPVSELHPEHSAECELCSYIFKKVFQKGFFYDN